MKLLSNPKDKFYKISQTLLDQVNRIPSFIFLFAIITFNFISRDLSPNEEHYLALAKQFFDNDWMPWSFSFNEWPGERLLYQYIAGILLNYLSFENTALLGKLLCFIMLSYPISLLIKKLEISNIDFFISFQLVFVFQQSFFAGEWIIEDFEPKTLAYPFIILALNYILNNQWYKVIISLIIATYFHFLIGGWFTLVFLVYYFGDKRKIKQLFIYGIIYGISIFPYFIYILNGTSQVPSEVDGIKYDFLITFFRNPWHSAIFSSLQTFFYFHLKGVLFFLAAFIISYFIFTKSSNKKLLAYNKINLIIFLQISFFLLVGIFDKSGFLLKFLPYRTESIALLLFILIGTKWFFESFKREASISFFRIGIASFAFALFFYNSVHNINKLSGSSKKQFTELFSYISQNTNSEDIFIFYGFSDPLDINSNTGLSFSRETRRNVLAQYKFVPYGEKIYEWYDRLMELHKIEKDIDHIWTTKQKYKIDYIISKNTLSEDGIELVLEDSTGYLYRIGNQNH